MESLWKGRQFDVYVEISGEMWKLLSFFLAYSVSETWQKHHHYRKILCECISTSHNHGSFNREKVPSDWSLFVHAVFFGMSRTAFLATVQWRNKKLRPVIGRHFDTTAIILSLGIGSHLYNNFVLCGSIFFVHAPNELYLHLLSCWLMWHCLAAGTQNII